MMKSKLKFKKLASKSLEIHYKLWWIDEIIINPCDFDYMVHMCQDLLWYISLDTIGTHTRNHFQSGLEKQFYIYLDASACVTYSVYNTLVMLDKRTTVKSLQKFLCVVEELSVLACFKELGYEHQL